MLPDFTTEEHSSGDATPNDGALFTSYSVAVWRGAVGRGWIERQLETGLLFQSQMATVGLLWIAIGLDVLLGGEALLRLLDVGAAAEIAARTISACRLSSRWPSWSCRCGAIQLGHGHAGIETR